MPTLRPWARSILQGNLWSDKMCPKYFGADASLLPIPSFPTRPPVAAPTRPRPDFPKDLESLESRGIVLHFFANHEILALELMALMLLKFPDAPQSFQMGLAGIMSDEQRHLDFYLRRMKDFGIAFGDIPTNDFFWKSMSGVESPYEFVTQMSLTFEQANLDFALHYEKEFQDVGDLATASVLRQVYNDEVKHVAHGLHWFREWKPAGLSDWKAYQSSLQEPLSPARAKGLNYCDDARRAAGFDENFIAELKVYSHSKGRVPRVFCFNPEMESTLAQRILKQDQKGLKIARVLKDDCASLMCFLAKADDIVVVPRMPSVHSRTQWQRVGFEMPELISDLSQLDTQSRKIGPVVPWAQDVNPQMYSKSWSAQWAREHFGSLQEIWGDVLCDQNDFGLEWDDSVSLSDLSVSAEYIAKAIFSVSGQSRLRFEALDDKVFKWIKKQKKVIVEPWKQKVMDLSFQFSILPPEGRSKNADTDVSLGICSNDRFKSHGWTRFLTKGSGQYEGAVLSRRMEELPADVIRFFYDQNVAQKLEVTAKLIAASLHGYVGPVGLDALLYQEAGRIKIKPVVEINPRFTMGRIALALEKSIKPNVVGLWCFIGRAQIAPHGSFGDWARSRQPLKLQQGSRHMIEGGVLMTNCPDQAQSHLTVLSVGRSLAQAREQLR